MMVSGVGIPDGLIGQFGHIPGCVLPSLGREVGAGRKCVYVCVVVRVDRFVYAL